MPIPPKCRGVRLRARTLPTCGANGLRVAVEFGYRPAVVIVSMGRHRLMKVKNKTGKWENGELRAHVKTISLGRHSRGGGNPDLQVRITLGLRLDSRLRGNDTGKLRRPWMLMPLPVLFLNFHDPMPIHVELN